jgi:hypothetical protein
MSEYTWLKDTENIKLSNKISHLIESQLPEFYKTDGINFVEFLKFYYKWMESHELTISDVAQDEYYVVLESEQGGLVLETGSELLLESDRTNKSAYEKDEIITGVSSGATGTVDRNTNTASSKIYVTGVTKTDFEVGELIKGTNNRTLGTVVSFQKNPLFASRTLLKSRDIDSTTSSILNSFSGEFLTNFPLNLSADKSLLIKHVSDIYRAKGTSTSYDFLFKSLYNIQNLNYYTPKIDLLKPSSGNWQQDQSVRIITDDPVSSFESHSVTGKQSGATGIVNRIEQFAAGIFDITELFLTNIEGIFIVGESIDSNEVDEVSGSGIAQGLISEITIDNSGSDYKIDDKLSFSGGGGVEAKAKITDIGSGALTSFTVFDGGDGYLENKELSVNNFATLGTGFAGKIKDVIDSFTFSTNEDIIGNFTTVQFDDLAYELSGDATANSEDRLIDAFGFSKLDAGHVSTVESTASGSGYEAIPKISVAEPLTENFTENSIQILNLNADPDELATTNAITDFFDPGEKITSNSGNKIGTFFGTVATDENIKNPSRIRVKTIKYLDGDVTQKIPIAQRNDLLVNNSTYLSTTKPSIYHVKFVTGGTGSVNTIKYRRGIDSREDFNSTDNTSVCDWYPTSGGIVVTGGYQTLEFGITSLTSVSTTATATTYGKHGLEDGQIVAIAGATQTEYNGSVTITVASTTSFSYTFAGSATSPATGTITYNENVSTKFTLPFGHTTDDEYAFSTIDFVSEEVITGANSSAMATVNTGVAFSAGGNLGNNAVIGVTSGDAGSGSIKSIEIQDPGVGFTSVPAITMPSLGAENAILTAKIGAMRSETGLYLDENGQLSSSKKLIDSDFYQNYSYSLIANKQLNDYQEIVFKLLHPIGTKLFGEFTPDPAEVNMGFDSRIKFEDGDLAIKEDGDDLLMEDQTNPKHEVIFNNNQNLGTGTITLTGNSDIVLGDATDFSATYGEGDHIVVDDEQSFEVSYGELRLENYLTGTITSSSSNVISIIGLSNTYPKTTTVPTVFSASSNFIENSIVTQISATTNEQVTGRVLRHELDNSNNNTLILHSCNGQFDVSSNANSITGNTSVININTYNMILEGGTPFIYDDEGRIIGSADLTGSLVSEEDGTSIIALEDSVYQNNKAIITSTFQYVKSNVIFGVATDFQADFRINDRIKPISTSENTKVIEVINSTCLIGNTAISTDISDNMILEIGTKINDGLSPTAPGDFVLENYDNNDNMILTFPSLEPRKFDNEDIQYYNLLEANVRGTTTANGIYTGNTSLAGIGSSFSEDLLVNDVISLSSNTSSKAKILTIVSQTLTLNRALGDGTVGQTIILHTFRNLDLERNATTITLSTPYDASNNFMNLTINSIATGLLLLEDGIGTANAGYIGGTSTEGSLKFEILSTFDNQTPKFIQT